MSMTLSELELAAYGERFIRAFESIRRALSLYPAAHPIVKAQLERFLENVHELRKRSGQASVHFAKGEFFVNGVPLKRLSLGYQKVIAAWEDKGIGLVSFDDRLDAAAASQFFAAIRQAEEEEEEKGEAHSPDLVQVLTQAGIPGVRTAHAAVGVAGEKDPDAAEEPAPNPSQVAEARSRWQASLEGLSAAVDKARGVRPHSTQAIKGLCRALEAQLLQRRAVRELAERLRTHDQESYNEALGGAVLAVLLGSALNLPPERLRLLGEAALLRDVGKLRLAADKAQTDPSDEHATADGKRHPVLGAELLLSCADIDPSAVIVALEHHAGYNLDGYPRLQQTRSLHPFSRIVAVAGDYYTMTCDRRGQQQLPPAAAAIKLVQGAGSSYDPAAVRCFLRLVGCFPEGTGVVLRDGRRGIVAGVGQQSWLAPRVAVVRDAEAVPVEPAIQATDGVASPGQSSVRQLWEPEPSDLKRLAMLRAAS